MNVDEEEKKSQTEYRHTYKARPSCQDATILRTNEKSYFHFYEEALPFNAQKEIQTAWPNYKEVEKRSKHIQINTP